MRNYALCQDLPLRKTKDFEIPVSVEKQVVAALYYLADARQTNTCLKSPIETLEKGSKYFKVNNEDVRTRHWRRSWVFIVNFEHISHLFTSVSTVDFEQVNVC